MSEDKRTWHEKLIDIRANWLWWATYWLSKKSGANTEIAADKATKAVTKAS